MASFMVHLISSGCVVILWIEKSWRPRDFDMIRISFTPLIQVSFAWLRLCLRTKLFLFIPLAHLCQSHDVCPIRCCHGYDMLDTCLLSGQILVNVWEWQVVSNFTDPSPTNIINEWVFVWCMMQYMSKDAWGGGGSFPSKHTLLPPPPPQRGHWGSIIYYWSTV